MVATALIFTFIIGYLCIILEHVIHINKGTSALMTAVLCWGILFLFPGGEGVLPMQSLNHHLSEVSEVILFLLGALTIVEIINAHKGFSLITSWINVRKKTALLWVTSFVTFFLSAILDNLTTTLVMVSLLSKIDHDKSSRWVIGSAIVIAANAGGAWTPMGDVTTTMLWIGGQITTFSIISSLFLPSFVCMLAATACFSFFLDGELPARDIAYLKTPFEPRGQLIFYLGIGSLIAVPLIKIFTGLPPYMGILFGLSLLWIVTDLVHAHHDDREHLKLPAIFTKVDLSGTLFFLGILLTVGALGSAGILTDLSVLLSNTFQSESSIAFLIGVFSAIVDNVPLVAATMNMYDPSVYVQDAPFWQLIAYCAGTGGSLLIIGSAAGVAFMSLEKVPFGWYMKRAAVPALVGYVAGFLVYLMVKF